MREQRPRIDAFMQFTGQMIPEWLSTRRELGPGPKLAYGRLARFKGRKAYAFPTHEELGEALGVSARQAARYVADLEAHDLIEVEQVGLNRPNRYYFLDHPWIHEMADQDDSGVDRSVRSGVDTDGNPGADRSGRSRPDTSDGSLHEDGGQTGSQSPPNPPQAGGDDSLSDVLAAHYGQPRVPAETDLRARTLRILTRAGVSPDELRAVLALEPPERALTRRWTDLARQAAEQAQTRVPCPDCDDRGVIYDPETDEARPCPHARSPGSAAA